MGTNPTANYTAAKIAAIHRIIADAQGALRWGGDYGDPSHGGVRGSRPDGMHIECVKNEAECARVLAIVTRTPQEDQLSAQFESDARARWPKEDQLNADLRADLHIKQLQIDSLVASVADLEKKVTALAVQKP